MAGRPTDHANLDLTQFNFDVVLGRAGGKVIWQPRILAWISDKEFAREPLPAPYTGMSLPQLYRALGCSNRIYDFGGCVPSREDPRVRFSQRDLNATDYEAVWETPVGNQRAVFRKSPNNPWHMPLKWPIAAKAEMKVAAWRELHRTYWWNQDWYEKMCQEWAGLGIPVAALCRTTVQKLFLEEMGVEAATFMLLDEPAACEEYFEALNVAQDRWLAIVNACPIMMVNFGDNLHAATLPPRWFKQYLLPLYQQRCELLHKHGKFVYSHWDGNCKALLPLARETGLDGIEAITPLPQGDVTLEETKAALGDMFLFDGIPAVYFDHTYSEQTLIDCAKRCIDLFAPHLVLGISDEISSHGDIERIRVVQKVVDDYNASL